MIKNVIVVYVVLTLCTTVFLTNHLLNVMNCMNVAGKKRKSKMSRSQKRNAKKATTKCTVRHIKGKDIILFLYLHFKYQPNFIYSVITSLYR